MGVRLLGWVGEWEFQKWSFGLLTVSNFTKLALTYSRRKSYLLTSINSILKCPTFFKCLSDLATFSEGSHSESPLFETNPELVLGRGEISRPERSRFCCRFLWLKQNSNFCHVGLSWRRSRLDQRFRNMNAIVP